MGEWMLFARFGGTVGAIPTDRVVETMRPLPTERLAGAPAFVRGLAVVRGAALPVIDGVHVVAGRAAVMGPHARCVPLRVGGGRAVLLVDEVVGVRRLGDAELAELPPLAGAAVAETVRAIGALDARLLVVLDAGRLVSDARAVLR
ncbi:MAG: chemotaxis protein CheW [Deltaproteobacteria bacterium]|nr:chemotaxis protein CheW [Deltaproteobacteria bacterium]